MTFTFRFGNPRPRRRRVPRAMYAQLPLSSMPNACCLLAAQNVTGLPDEPIKAAATRLGWRPGQGMYSTAWIAMFKDLGVDMVPVLSLGGGDKARDHVAFGMYRTRGRSYHCTLKQFLARYSRGIYVVNVARHLLVVRDGVILERGSKPMVRRHVWSAFKVDNVAKCDRIAA